MYQVKRDPPVIIIGVHIKKVKKGLCLALRGGTSRPKLRE
jgi:hypothetical protein